MATRKWKTEFSLPSSCSSSYYWSQFVRTKLRFSNWCRGWTISSSMVFSQVIRKFSWGKIFITSWEVFWSATMLKIAFPSFRSARIFILTFYGNSNAISMWNSRLRAKFPIELYENWFLNFEVDSKWESFLTNDPFRWKSEKKLRSSSE